MKFQITEIEFDFDNGDDGHVDSTGQEIYLSIIEKQQLVDEAIGQIWDADDEDDLVEEITCAYGWCIKSLDYRYIPS